MERSIEVQAEHVPGEWHRVNVLKAASTGKAFHEAREEAERLCDGWVRSGYFGGARMRVRLR